MRIPLLLSILVAVLAPAPGCRTEPMDPNTYNDKPPGQRYSYDEVKRRARELKPGMARIEVMLTLGSPAENRGDTWVYLPARPGFLVPAEMLVVHFRDGLYTKRETRPIILGEKINAP